MRFAPHGERSIEEQIESLQSEEKECFDSLKKKWNTENPEQTFSDEMILRFARCSPGTKKFNSKASYKVMKKYDQRYLTLTAGGMEKQLFSKVCYSTCKKEILSAVALLNFITSHRTAL
jgi:hypothetical protein